MSPNIDEIVAVLPEQPDPRAAAVEWLAAGYDDAEEIAAWVAARCYTAADAQAVENAGITPEQAARLTTAGRTASPDTLAAKLVRGDLTLTEVRQIITSDFWND